MHCSLLFSPGCPTCTALAREVEQMTQGRLKMQWEEEFHQACPDKW